MTKSRTCRSFNRNVSQSLSVVCDPKRKNFGLLRTGCGWGQIPAAIASAAIVAMFVYFCLHFANPKSDLNFRSAILNLLKISYLFILLNFRWDRIVRINFGLSGFAQSETTRITAQRIARGTFGLRIFGDKWHAPFILSPNEQCQSTEGINSKESNQGNHRMASSFIDQMMDS